MRQFIGGFFAFLDIHTTLVAQFYEIIHVIKETKNMSLTSLCLECDSALVCAAFIARTNVPWILCNRWNTWVD